VLVDVSPAAKPATGKKTENNNITASHGSPRRIRKLQCDFGCTRGIWLSLALYDNKNHASIAVVWQEAIGGGNAHGCGLATALALHFRLLVCACACCRLMPETPQAPPKESRRKKFRRLKLITYARKLRTAYFLRRIQPANPRRPPMPQMANDVGSGTTMAKLLKLPRL
jgi:hypothetical protein